jgi:hypothetical protein
MPRKSKVPKVLQERWNDFYEFIGAAARAKEELDK